ncbi:UNVERIFIED_CONTAM: hypothetical protein GTU68_041972 [Idotea baltica]|nr:hypothetical protein [Idotea baltica]
MVITHIASKPFFWKDNAPAAFRRKAEQLNGKRPLYNTCLDLDVCLFDCSRLLMSPAADRQLNTPTPCGWCCWGLHQYALPRSIAGDPVSCVRSIIGFNRTVDAPTAELLAEPGRFVEAIIAPDFGEDALEILTTKPKWKNNVRLLKVPDFEDRSSKSLEYRRVSGGLLVQDRDDQADPEDAYEVVTERKPTPEELRDLKFAWKVCKHVKSNAILFAKDSMVIGVGAGQMSRLDSSFIAAHKSGDRSQGAVVASDAFFPFRDGVDEAAKAGVKAIIQPGGSRNDAQVIDACNEHGIAMIFTGRRHFKH